MTRRMRRRDVVACVLALTLASGQALGAGAAPVLGYHVVASMPHDSAAFTQGLLVDRGAFLESTGRYGQSTLRRVRIADGEVLEKVQLPRRLFGEGLALHGEQLFQLTWRSGVMLVYSRETLERLRVVRYEGEGWGIASAGDRLVMSNGSSILTWLDAEATRVLGQLQVTDAGAPVARLNELEWLPGGEGKPPRLLANVWQSDRIAVIDPGSGQVSAWIDLEGLLSGPYQLDAGAVLNGVAFDHDTRRLYVTGKLWPRLFEIVSPALDGYLEKTYEEAIR